MNKRRQDRVLVGLFLLSLFLTSGCDKYTRHDVLAFFFTGVPAAHHEGVDGKIISEALYFLHGPYAARQCYQCHVKSPVSLHIPILGLPAEKQCYQCHVRSPALADEKKPVSIFRLKARPPGSLVLPLKELCLECHPPKKISAAHWSHEGPVSNGNCIFCHDPHQSPFRYMLRKGI